MLPDISDSAPDFDILRSTFYQVNPTYVLVNKNSEDRFLEVLNQLTGNSVAAVGAEGGGPGQGQGRPRNANEEDDTETRSMNDTVCLYQLPSKDFNPFTCKERVYSIKLPFEPKTNGQQEHMMFLTSLIPFSNENMIRAMGCLLKFLDRCGRELFKIDVAQGQAPVVDVCLFKM